MDQIFFLFGSIVSLEVVIRFGLLFVVFSPRAFKLGLYWFVNTTFRIKSSDVKMFIFGPEFFERNFIIFPVSMGPKAFERAPYCMV